MPAFGLLVLATFASAAEGDNNKEITASVKDVSTCFMKLRILAICILLLSAFVAAGMTGKIQSHEDYIPCQMLPLYVTFMTCALASAWFLTHTFKPQNVAKGFAISVLSAILAYLGGTFLANGIDVLAGSITALLLWSFLVIRLMIKDEQERALITESSKLLQFVFFSKDVQLVGIAGGESNVVNQVAKSTLFNSLNYVRQDRLSNEIKIALEKLHTEVGRILGLLPESNQQELARDLQTFAGEALSTKPRLNWCKLSSEAIISTATALGGTADPVVKAVEVVQNLLNNGN